MGGSSGGAYMLDSGYSSAWEVSKVPIFAQNLIDFNLLLVWVPPGKDKHRYLSYPRTLQHDEGTGLTRDLAILIAMKTEHGVLKQ